MRKFAYVLIMAETERKASQWVSLELHTGPLIMSLIPRFTDEGN